MGFVIIEDTRNKPGKHRAKNDFWANAGVSVTRSKLAVGDYCLPPSVAVDTKESIAELAGNITCDHERFRRECIAARDQGTHLIVLTENIHGVCDLVGLAQWVEPLEDFAKRKHAQQRFHGDRLAKACKTMGDRYGVEFRFCAPDEAAQMILDILGEVQHL